MFLNLLAIGPSSSGHRDRLPRKPLPSREGVTIVESSLLLVLFFLVLFAIFEFARAFMVIHTLQAAARSGARAGAVEGSTTQEVLDRVRAVLGSALDPDKITVLVKDGSDFDSNPSSIDYGALPGIDLSQAPPGQMFLVRLEVPFGLVSLLPPTWIQGVTLSGQSVMRHE